MIYFCLPQIIWVEILRDWTITKDLQKFDSALTSNNSRHVLISDLYGASYFCLDIFIPHYYDGVVSNTGWIFNRQIKFKKFICSDQSFHNCGELESAHVCTLKGLNTERLVALYFTRCRIDLHAAVNICPNLKSLTFSFGTWIDLTHLSSINTSILQNLEILSLSDMCAVSPVARFFISHCRSLTRFSMLSFTHFEPMDEHLTQHDLETLLVNNPCLEQLDFDKKGFIMSGDFLDIMLQNSAIHTLSLPTDRNIIHHIERVIDCGRIIDCRFTHYISFGQELFGDDDVFIPYNKIILSYDRAEINNTICIQHIVHDDRGYDVFDYPNGFYATPSVGMTAFYREFGKLLQKDTAVTEVNFHNCDDIGSEVALEMIVNASKNIQYFVIYQNVAFMRDFVRYFAPLFAVSKTIKFCIEQHSDNYYTLYDKFRGRFYKMIKGEIQLQPPPPRPSKFRQYLETMKLKKALSTAISDVTTSY